MGIALRAVLLQSSLLVTVRATGCISFVSPTSYGLIIPLLPTICQLSGSKLHDCAGQCKTVHPLRIILFLNGLHRHCRTYREQLRSASAPLIRARSVVQVHPGPPFVSVSYRVLHQKPQPTIQPTTHCTIELPTPSAVRYSPCAARVSSLSSCVYRSSVV
jgi:hypothetical protein